MNIHPINSYYVIEPIKVAEQKTDAGIIINEAAQPYNKGKIVAISREIPNSPLKTGDTVLYDRGAGNEVNGLFIIDHRNIVAIID